jgi:glutathione synthase/RimK-type ligase-like ATP-grasp enzyme
MSVDLADILQRARAHTAVGDDSAAQAAYIEILRSDPRHLVALTELGNLALSGGFRSAARTAYLEAVKHHPGNAVARINLANVLRQENDFQGARQHYESALALDPHLPEAHQGMAWALAEVDPERAERHWHQGFSGHSMVVKAYRGSGVAVPLLLLVSARGGNIPTQLWIDERQFAITALFTEFYEPGTPLPEHTLVVNAIGDADLCKDALERAAQLLARTTAPVINRPERVQNTGRAAIARRLAALPGVRAPRIDTVSPDAIRDRADGLEFPLLLRRPGFHTGEHFLYVAERAGLDGALASLAGDELLLISYLDARGADGMARKYRVMFIDGVLYPLHLAISRDWKVHYFTSNMADDAAYRAEERRFLDNMAQVLGAGAMTALEQICANLGLEYAGIDFALGVDGTVLLFEANAAMVVFPPGPDPIWDYRRPAITNILASATRMLVKHALSMAS